MDEPQQLADGLVRLGTPVVNWYLVADDSGVTVVDSGCQGFLPQLDPGLRLLGRSREDIRAFLLTHGDGDHVGVAAKMQHEGDETPIHLNPADRYLVEKHRKKDEENTLAMLARPATWRLFGHFTRYGVLNQPKIERTADLGETDALEVPGRPRVIHTPGHTEGHMVFHFPRHGALFVGDTICTWHPISGERGPQQMPFNVSNATGLDSLSRYADLDAELVLVGHGEPWTEGPAGAVDRARAAAAGMSRVSA
jgi:glyoxylase-like metal-dependent hydrolase (beta-lactamase superfamily II)